MWGESSQKKNGEQAPGGGERNKCKQPYSHVGKRPQGGVVNSNMAKGVNWHTVEGDKRQRESGAEERLGPWEDSNSMNGFQTREPIRPMGTRTG